MSLQPVTKGIGAGFWDDEGIYGSVFLLQSSCKDLLAGLLEFQQDRKETYRAEYENGEGVGQMSHFSFAREDGGYRLSLEVIGDHLQLQNTLRLHLGSKELAWLIEHLEEFIRSSET